MRTVPNPIAATLSLVLLFAPHPSTAFYLPGVAPTTYRRGDRVPLHVNRLTPAQSQNDGQVHSVYSYDYYSQPLHFCEPEGGPDYVSESLGSIIFGDRIMTSPFELHMAQDETCKTIPSCGKRTYDVVSAKFVNKRILQNYDINWLVDGLPAGQLLLDPTTETEFYSPGFDLGHMDGNKAVFHNHYDISIEYHEAGYDQFRVVGILVEPSSNKNARDLGDGKGECKNMDDLVLDEHGGTEVVFTYSVYWKRSETPFATRWDKYLHVYDPKIHWFSLINSAVIVIVLCSMVFVILARTLRKDITRYNKLDQFALSDMGNGDASLHDDDIQEDSGWKLIHGDVFRPPKYPLALSVLVGNGAQLFMMAGFTIAFAGMGFLSPSNRGSIGSVMILLYCLFGAVNGFVSSYIYKSLGGTDANDWKLNIILTPLALPIVVFATFFLLNFLLWINSSSGAVPFTTMIVLVLIYFVISVPLSCLGSYLALKRAPTYAAPVKTNQIPRQIPDPATLSTSSWQTFLNRPTPAILLSGILPFGAIYVEVHFIMSSLWSTRIYYMFGFLFLSFGLMLVTCAAVTVLNVYFLLCSENYHWQWRAVLTSGACAVYVFVNALVFWISRLSFGSVTSGLLYLGYSALGSAAVGIVAGSVGFGCAWAFVHGIYGRVKVD